MVSASSQTSAALLLTSETISKDSFPDPFDDPIIFHAIGLGDLSCCRCLLGIQADDLDCVDIYGQSPLMAAIRSHHLEIVELFLEYQPNFSFLDGSGKFALLVAVEEGNMEILRALLAAGADPNFVNSMGFSALHCSAQEDNLECAKELLEFSANPNLIDQNGYTAFLCAAKNESWDVAELLEPSELAFLDQRDYFGNTALIYAAKQNNQAAVFRLLRAGAAMNFQNLESHTALTLAALQGNLDIAFLFACENYDFFLIEQTRVQQKVQDLCCQELIFQDQEPQNVLLQDFQSILVCLETIKVRYQSVFYHQMSCKALAGFKPGF